MIDLPPEAHALLEKARREHNPTADDAERIRRSLHAQLGIAAALAPSMVATSASASAAHATSGVAKGTLWFGLKTKVVLAVVTLSGVASVPMMMHSDVRPRAAAPGATCAPHCPEGAEASVTASTTAPEPEVEPTPRTEPLVGRRAERRARRHERRQRAAETQREGRDEPQLPSATSSAGVPGASPGASTRTPVAAVAADGIPARTGEPERNGSAEIARARGTPTPTPQAEPTSEARTPPELMLIRGALTNLRDGAPQRALGLLSEHATHYPEGAFASERRGLRIVALCASGRLDEGLRERVVFLRREGSAPVAERVRHACQEAPGK